MNLVDAVLRKSREGQRTQEEFFRAHADRLVACATAMSERFARGGRLYAMGNGGSACDAEHAVVEMMHPVLGRRPALPAIALAGAAALGTAIGNDQDFAQVFAAQLRMLSGADDMALAITTSGKSQNLIRALAVARERGMLIVGLAGRDGGRMPELCDHCFVVESFSIHRIQETHATAIHVLWDLIHLSRGAEDLL